MKSKNDLTIIFLTANKVPEKIAFTRLEVLNNNTNVNILEDKAQICGLNPTDVGVPFLWDGSRCILGYIDVIQFFKDKLLKK